MADEPPEPARRRRIARGEGEVTDWPRGLEGYVPSGPEDDIPDPEEDRTGNRLRVVARVLAVLRSQGQDVEAEVRDLAAAERVYAAGDKAEANRRADRLLAELDARRSGTR